MTAPPEDRRASEVGNRPADRTRWEVRRARRPHREPVVDQTVRSREEPVNRTRRIRLLPFPVTAAGTVDLPDGAVVVALDFEDDGGFGYRRRPATAWADVVTGDSTERSPDEPSSIP
jgi:hypothetical protein